MMQSASAKTARSGLGRPTSYTKEIGSEFCARIASNQTIKQVCEDANMPSERTMYYWLDRHPEFLQEYQFAQQFRATMLADEMVSIADNCREGWVETGDPNKPLWVTEKEALEMAKLQITERRWLAGRMTPKRATLRARRNANAAEAAKSQHKQQIDPKGLDTRVC